MLFIGGYYQLVQQGRLSVPSCAGISQAYMLSDIVRPPPPSLRKPPVAYQAVSTTDGNLKGGEDAGAASSEKRDTRALIIGTTVPSPKHRTLHYFTKKGCWGVGKRCS
jgi:hypothetical protein